MSASKTQSLARTPDHAKIAPAETPKTAIPVFPALAKVDLQLAVDAKSQLENDKERLVQISRENGALGGRPPINTVELMQYCLDTEFSYYGQYTLRHYKSKWYLFKDGCYRTIPEEDIDAKVTGCLIRAGLLTKLRSYLRMENSQILKAYLRHLQVAARLVWNGSLRIRGRQELQLVAFLPRITCRG